MKKKNYAFKHIAKYIPFYLIALVFSFFAEYIDSLITLFMGEALALFNNEESVLPSYLQGFITRDDTRNAIISICVVFLSIALIGVVMKLLRSFVKSYATNMMTSKLVVGFFSHVIDLPKSYLTSHSTGDIIQRNIQDTKKYIRFYNDSLWHLLSAVFAVSSLLIQIFRLNKINFVISFVVILIVISLGVFFCFFHIKKKEEISSKYASELDSRTQQSFTNISMVKTFSNEKVEQEKFSKSVINKEKAGFEVSHDYSKYWLSMDVLSSIYALVSMIVIGYLFYIGSLGLGVATSLVLISGRIVGISSEIVSHINTMLKTRVARKRLNEYLTIKTDFEEDGDLTPQIEGNIEFKNVYMAYKDDIEHDILKNIIFTINKGETIGIIGKSGSGKSSIINVLTKVDDYQKGSILVDGVELKDIKKKYLRDNIAIVNQESFVFAKTIKENLTILNSRIKDIDSYVDRVCLSDDISNMVSGYDTVVGERGITLSGGQKQRISIARSLIKEENILILDDSLSALDNNVARKIKEGLKDNKCTTIIISHNLMNVMDADKILVLDKGQIIDSGTHEELINRDGLYKDVWSLQQNIKVGDEDE